MSATLDQMKRDMEATIRVRGLWGDRFLVGGQSMQTVDGDLTIGIQTQAGTVPALDIRVEA